RDGAVLVEPVRPGVCRRCWAAASGPDAVMLPVALALIFLKKTLYRHGQPETFAIGRLRSCGAAMRDLSPGSEDYETGRWLNNRAENSHLPFRRRECAMQQFRWMRSLLKFAPVRASV